MKTLVLAVIALVGIAHAAEEPFELGSNQNTTIIENNNNDGICPGTDLLQNDNGTFENAIAWGGLGTIEDGYYGSWAECYDPDFVCGIQFLFTQVGDYTGKTMRVLVWDVVGGPTPIPGNILCIVPDVDPGPPAYWPEVSTHDVQVCCETGGAHFVGFWPNWPGENPEWFLAVDENGQGEGCPRTNIAPGIGYPSGWQHPNVVPPFANTKDLGIREFAGIGDCSPSPTQKTTWGKIKSLY